MITDYIQNSSEDQNKDNSGDQNGSNLIDFQQLKDKDQEGGVRVSLRNDKLIILGIILKDAEGFYGCQAMPVVIPPSAWEKVSSEISSEVISVQVGSGEVRALGVIISENNMFREILHNIISGDITLQSHIAYAPDAESDECYAQVDFIYKNELWSIRRGTMGISVIRKRDGILEEPAEIPSFNEIEVMQTFRPSNGLEGFRKEYDSYTDAFNRQHSITSIASYYQKYFQTVSE